MWIKICGVTDVATAEEICRLSADAIGLNFYSKSPRCVTPEMAARIASATGTSLQRVGVFVNQSVDEIVRLATAGQLDVVQVHGDESPAMVAEITARLDGRPLFRAWRMEDSLADLADHLEECAALGASPQGCLIDARVPGSFGGTGHVVPWDVLNREYRRESWPHLVLAGGLNADNVADAIRVVAPWGVDVASGVEVSPGIKDFVKVRQFIERARDAAP
jgi:phosphoribosylanthranilate isomerase